MSWINTPLARCFWPIKAGPSLFCWPMRSQRFCVDQSEGGLVMWIQTTRHSSCQLEESEHNPSEALCSISHISRSLNMKGVMFNIDNGYLEGLCRGFKNGEGLSQVNWTMNFLSSYNFDKSRKNNKLYQSQECSVKTTTWTWYSARHWKTWSSTCSRQTMETSSPVKALCRCVQKSPLQDFH